MTVHGENAYLYQQGCRCVPCTEANRMAQRRRRLALNGWALEDYTAAFAEQGGVCAICHEPDPRYPALKADHDHATGRRRALLCSRCNLILGGVEDSPTILLAMFEYIGKYTDLSEYVKPQRNTVTLLGVKWDEPLTVLGHPMSDVIKWKAAWGMHHPEERKPKCNCLGAPFGSHVPTCQFAEAKPFA
jgi:hypothetical protein